MERIVCYDFFLKYPEFLDSKKSEDFDTKFSYFHWKPNYKLYDSVLADAQARCLIKLKPESSNYISTELGTEFISGMSNSYIENLTESSKYIEKNICKLSNKAINEKISVLLTTSRGVEL